MEISVLARQALLYGHLIAFALALATVLKEDVRLLRAKRVDWASLVASAKLVKWLLLALWVTGIPMLIGDVGTDVSLLLGKPKLLAKLIVVGTLTVNGILLHLVAFPMVWSKPQNPAKVATIAATLGAVSTTSWLYASFLGAARPVAPYFSLYDFIIFYLSALAISATLAILMVRGRLERSLKSSYNLTNTSVSQGYSRSVAHLEAEIARLALSDMQRRHRTKHFAQQFSARETSSVTARKRTLVPWAEALRDRMSSEDYAGERGRFPNAAPMRFASMAGQTDIFIGGTAEPLDSATAEQPAKPSSG
jgi:hypothetical protein